MNFGYYSLTVFSALFGWPLMAFALALWVGPRRAIVATFVLGWLLLPNAQYFLKGLPEYSKVEAIALAAAVVMLSFDHARLRTLRPRREDIPMAVFILAPMASSLSNGLGAYDGMSGIVERALEWGVPWVVGRLYFPSFAAMRDLAVGVVLGGLLYTPLCLYELRMSPQLHRIVYGFHQHTFAQVRRFGGWRPMVFMQHGLALGLYMGGSAFVALWLWTRRGVAEVAKMPIAFVALGLIAMALACKSLGSIVLVFAGVVALYAARWAKRRALIFALILVVPTYMVARGTETWSAQNLLDAVQNTVPDRARSLQKRIDSETILAYKARQRPVFGWGAWGRNRVKNEHGKDVAVPDGLWIIYFGVNGVFGLGAFTIAMLLPVVLFLRRAPPPVLFSRACAPATVLAMLVVVFMLDCLLNAMVNPTFILVAGGLAGMDPAREYAALRQRQGIERLRRLQAAAVSAGRRAARVAGDVS